MTFSHNVKRSIKSFFREIYVVCLNQSDKNAQIYVEIFQGDCTCTHLTWIFHKKPHHYNISASMFVGHGPCDYFLALNWTLNGRCFAKIDEIRWSSKSYPNDWVSGVLLALEERRYVIFNLLDTLLLNITLMQTNK